MGVYFIQAGEDGPIKIGRSRNVKARLASLQVSAPERLTLIAFYAAPPVEEARLHRLLAEHRITGEWFRPHADVLAVVAEAKSRIVSRGGTPLHRAVVRIAALLERPHMSHAMLATVAGVHPNTLKSVGTPEWNPLAKTFDKIMVAVGRLEKTHPEGKTEGK